MTKIYNIDDSTSLFPKFFKFSWKTQSIEWFTLIFAAVHMINSPLDIAIREEIPEKSTILFGILEWGLGHATRSIPIIAALEKAGHTVIIAGEKKSIQWLKNEYPGIVCVTLPDSGFKHQGRYLISNIATNIRPMIRQFLADRRVIKKIVRSCGARIIISDNRFFFRSQSVQKNIYVTHQTTLFHRYRIVKGILTEGHRCCIRPFDQCWIYDDISTRLAGMLSAPGNIRSFRYIGIHSRLNIEPRPSKLYDVLFLLSGPEPQRSIFEEKVVCWIQQHPQYRVYLIRGTTSPLSNPIDLEKTCVTDLADSHTLSSILGVCASIVARPGYTTLMDLKNLKIPVLWVPTPGQTEQEYLGKYHGEKNNQYVTVDQQEWEQDLDIFLIKYAITDLVNR